MGYAPLRDGSLVCPRRAAPQGSEASLRMLTEAAPTGGGRTSPEKLPATIEQLNISAEEAATCAAEDECCDVSSDLDDRQLGGRGCSSGGEARGDRGGGCGRASGAQE